MKYERHVCVCSSVRASVRSIELASGTDAAVCEVGLSSFFFFVLYGYGLCAEQCQSVSPSYFTVPPYNVPSKLHD